VFVPGSRPDGFKVIMFRDYRLVNRDKVVILNHEFLL
jgi:hypothetical protein